MNKAMLTGRLGRDPELLYTRKGTPVLSMRIATNESYTDKDGNKVDKAEWHTVICFSRLAENCASYLKKGSLVSLDGSLQTRKWQDKDGNDRYTTEIRARHIEFLSRAQQEPQDDVPIDDHDNLSPAFPDEPLPVDDVPF